MTRDPQKVPQKVKKWPHPVERGGPPPCPHHAPPLSVSLCSCAGPIYIYTKAKEQSPSLAYFTRTHNRRKSSGSENVAASGGSPGHLQSFFLRLSESSVLSALAPPFTTACRVKQRLWKGTYFVHVNMLFFGFICWERNKATGFFSLSILFFLPS